MKSVLRTWGLAVSFLSPAIFPALPARADIGVALADPTPAGVSRFTHSGHSLVYLSGVCPASPVRARLCEPGEQGSIVTMYPDFYEKQPYSWNIVPLSIYLDGSSTLGDRLLYASPTVKEALEQHARAGYLHPVCEDACPELLHAYWRDLEAATIRRDVFIYAVHSTREQDQAAVDWLNGHPNVNQYRTITDNCSDFTRHFINSILPHAVHRDVLNDLAMMSPKAAAHSFADFARKRPELGLYSVHFAQQPGATPRADVARSGTEDGFHMKKYLVPFALIGDHEIAGSFFVAYFLTGRFGLWKQYELHPVTTAGNVNQNGSRPGYADGPVLDTDGEQQRTAVLGDKAAWEQLAEQFASLTRRPDVHSLTAEWSSSNKRNSWPKRLFPPAFDTGSVTVDEKGRPWLSVKESEMVRRVGLSSANVLAPSSDPELAAELMLGRVGYAVQAKNHFRESMPELLEDWSLLQAALARLERTAGPPSTVTADIR